MTTMAGLAMIIAKQYDVREVTPGSLSCTASMVFGFTLPLVASIIL